MNLVTVAESLLPENEISMNERSSAFIGRAGDETGLYLPKLT